MKTSLLLGSLFLLTLGASAADAPLLAVPGAVIYENKLDAAPAAPWKARQVNDKVTAVIRCFMARPLGVDS